MNYIRPDEQPLPFRYSFVYAYRLVEDMPIQLIIKGFEHSVPPRRFFETLCFESARRFFKLCHPDISLDEFYNGLKTGGDIDSMISIVQRKFAVNDRYCFKIGWTYNGADNGHTFTFAKLDGKLYKLEASLGDHMQCCVEFSIDDLKDYLSKFDTDEFNYHEYSIPSDKQIRRNYHTIKSRLKDLKKIYRDISEMMGPPCQLGIVRKTRQ